MGSQTEVADLFKARWDEFTRTDRKIARVVLANYPAAGLETLAVLSKRANVSAPSILRCVKKLGFDGYPEFQRALHAEVHRKIRDRADQSPIEVEGSASHLPPSVQDLCQSYFTDMAETFELLQTAELDRVVDLLADNTRSLTMLGGRASGALARVTYRRLMMMRPNCTLLSSDPLERSERLIDIGKRDVVVAFDHPPYDARTASFAALANERKAKIVLFTDTRMSPIAEFADSVLCASGGKPDEFSLASTVCLIEIVFAAIHGLVGEHAQDRRQKLKEIKS